MKINLILNNQEKTFEAPFVSARQLKNTLELSEKVDKEGLTVEVIDKLCTFVVGIYGNQFTVDELLDGYPAQEFFMKALEDMQNIIHGFDKSVKN